MIKKSARPIFFFCFEQSTEKMSVQQFRNSKMKPSEVVIIYGSDWCPYCKMAIEISEKLDRKFKKLFSYVFIEVDHIEKGSVDEKIMNDYGDGTIPLIFAKNMRTNKFRKIGGLQEYKSYVEKHANKMQRQKMNIDQQVMEMKMVIHNQNSRRSKSDPAYIDEAMIQSSSRGSRSKYYQ